MGEEIRHVGELMRSWRQSTAHKHIMQTNNVMQESVMPFDKLSRGLAMISVTKALDSMPANPQVIKGIAMPPSANHPYIAG